jgi:ethanolamine utilization cobalamin adenosyltransferase
VSTFITETELRELWCNGRGEIPPFSADTRLSPSAQDFLKDHGFEIRLEGAPVLAESSEANAGKLGPGVGSGLLADGGMPHACSHCGKPLGRPEEMLELDAGYVVPKTAPRMKLRRRLDSLRAQVMLVGAQARRHQLSDLVPSLDTLAAYCSEIMVAESLARPVAPLVLSGKSEEELDEISQWPDGHLSWQKAGPTPDDHEILHGLNVVRTGALDVEVSALEAFPPDWTELWALGQGLARALNRVASAAYALSLLFKEASLTGKSP